MKLFDVFICHASEDKKDFVRPLAHKLEAEHLHVWYDEFSLKLGDSLRRSIDIGLSRSRYGVVVLSPNFFKKQWPQRELDGLVTRETIGRERVILPIWHHITKEQICEYSPTIADLVAVSSANGINPVIKELLKVIRPYGSPLIIARDRLIDFGLSPPVVTDEWWLDVVEASNREDSWGIFPHREHWGRWTFPLPEGDNPFERGERLAWTAMQMSWEQAADERLISQITPPEQVLDFIDSQPGLSEIVVKYPRFLAVYAPQLTIRGFGGKFENLFNDLLINSIVEYEARNRTDSKFGSALTTTGCPPKCEEEIALHHPTFGDYEPAMIAGTFVMGEIAGPPCRLYETYDYLVWLLSDKSEWLPTAIRDFLILGMQEWDTWAWFDLPNEYRNKFEVESYNGIGKLAEELNKSKHFSHFAFGTKEEQDILQRTEITCQLLSLNESAQVLVERFLEKGFLKAHFRQQNKRRKK